jgi:hypothetical protein
VEKKVSTPIYPVGTMDPFLFLIDLKIPWIHGLMLGIMKNGMGMAMTTCNP